VGKAVQKRGASSRRPIFVLVTVCWLSLQSGRSGQGGPKGQAGFEVRHLGWRTVCAAGQWVDGVSGATPRAREGTEQRSRGPEP
jgi:hypothetical protein